MTTIAYRDGVLAADSQSTYDTMIVPGEEHKLEQVICDGRDTIAGYAGSTAYGRKLLKWANIGAGTLSEEPPPGDGVMVLLFSAKGFREGLWVVEDGSLYREQAPFMAWGSGRAYALAALHMGASAEEAVRIAGLCHTHTGGRIWTGRFDSDGRIVIEPAPAPASPPSRTA